MSIRHQDDSMIGEMGFEYYCGPVYDGIAVLSGSAN